MKMPFVKTTWENSIKANAALSFAALILSITSLISVINAQGQHDRIVLTPMVIEKEMSIAWTGADENYMKAFGLSIGQLVGNMTPENVNFILEALSRYIHSSIYTDLRNKILVVASTRQFKEMASATRFLPESVSFEPVTSKVFVTGMMETITALGKDRRVMTYEMTVKIEQGAPVIYTFDSYTDQPHTKDWISNHPVAPDAAKKDEAIK